MLFSYALCYFRKTFVHLCNKLHHNLCLYQNTTCRLLLILCSGLMIFSLVVETYHCSESWITRGEIRINYFKPYVLINCEISLICFACNIHVRQWGYNSFTPLLETSFWSTFRASWLFIVGRFGDVRLYLGHFTSRFRDSKIVNFLLSFVELFFFFVRCTPAACRIHRQPSKAARVLCRDGRWLVLE